jgi:hypothetical protein
MKWTKTLPTEAGFYWYRRDKHNPGWIVPIVQLPNGKVRRDTGNGTLIDLDPHEGSEWAGPIEAPKEER